MDYENISYEDAKRQLVKAAMPSLAGVGDAVSGAAGGAADWLGDLGAKALSSNIGKNISQSYANPDHAAYWNAGLGAAGGAGFGALSSLWQPKKRRNTLGRTLTGGLLGGLVGGAGTLLKDAPAASAKAQEGRRLEGGLAGAKDKAKAAYEGGTLGEALGFGGSNRKSKPEDLSELSKAQTIRRGVPGWGSGEEDAIALMKGELPQYGILPELGGVAAAGLSHRNIRGHRGGLPGRSAATLSSTIDTLQGGNQVQGRAAADLAASEAHEKLRTQFQGKKKFQNLPERAWKQIKQLPNRAVHGNLATRVLTGKGLNTMATNASIPGHEADLPTGPMDQSATAADKLTAGRRLRADRMKGLTAKVRGPANTARLDNLGRMGRAGNVGKSVGAGILADLMVRYGLDKATGTHADRLAKLRKAHMDNVAKFEQRIALNNAK